MVTFGGKVVLPLLYTKSYPPKNHGMCQTPPRPTPKVSIPESPLTQTHTSPRTTPAPEFPPPLHCLFHCLFPQTEKEATLITGVSYCTHTLPWDSKKLQSYNSIIFFQVCLPSCSRLKDFFDNFTFNSNRPGISHAPNTFDSDRNYWRYAYMRQ